MHAKAKIDAQAPKEATRAWAMCVHVVILDPGYVGAGG